MAGVEHASFSSMDFSHEPQIGGTLYARHANAEVELLPNPDFTFPARQSTDGVSPTSSQRPMSAHLANPSRSRMAGMSSRRTASTLPNFTFNPAAPSPSESASDPTTPPRSPTFLGAPGSPSRPYGHRRGGSEFIGGDGQNKRGSVLSTSPTKGDNVLPPPLSSGRLGAPAGRRGHAHRRSGAISCHDLQSILQPKEDKSADNSEVHAESAPVTPFGADNFPVEVDTRRTMSVSSLKPSTPEKRGYGFSDQDSDDSPPRPVSRTRVGFSETIEYIRPLSTISSGTESSMSTIRGHSVNGSLSSVLSTGSSPASGRPSRPSLQTTFEDQLPSITRPSTASGVLEALSAVKEEFGISPTMLQRPSTATAPESPSIVSTPGDSPIKSKHSKRRHLGWFNDRLSSRPLSGIGLETRSEPSLHVTPPDTARLAADQQQEDEAADERARAIKIDGERKPRKVKSWAHSWISGRNKPKVPTAEGAPQPVPQSPVTEEREDAAPEPEHSIFNLVPDFDSDNTVDIVTAPAQACPSPISSTFSAHTPLSATSLNFEVTSPIIDLDAALGPFNTPPIGARGGATRPAGGRRVMHSGSFGNVLGSFGDHHRRTESAPELAPFESRTSPMNVMADVFEEDEEEDSETPRYKSRAGVMLQKSPSQPPKPDSVLGSPVPSHCEQSKMSAPSVICETGLGISGDTQNDVDHENNNGIDQVPFSGQHQPSQWSSFETQVSRIPSPIEVVEDHEEPRASSLGRDSDSTVTPTLSEDGTKHPGLIDVDLPLVSPSLVTSDSLASSPLSTPDYNHGGRGSYDTPRLGTSVSSIADSRTVNSFLSSEPGPEFRPSVDDVPSLSSSRSTMTSPGQHPLAQGLSIFDARSASVGSIPSAGAERSRKRSSIASLSRLISGSYSEKSKLSIESRPQSSDRSISQGEEMTKMKKKKRISRLMSFWKGKESLASS